MWLCGACTHAFWVSICLWMYMQVCTPCESDSSDLIPWGHASVLATSLWVVRLHSWESLEWVRSHERRWRWMDDFEGGRESGMVEEKNGWRGWDDRENGLHGGTIELGIVDKRAWWKKSWMEVARIEEMWGIEAPCCSLGLGVYGNGSKHDISLAASGTTSLPNDSSATQWVVKLQPPELSPSPVQLPPTTNQEPSFSLRARKQTLSSQASHWKLDCWSRHCHPENCWSTYCAIIAFRHILFRGDPIYSIPFWVQSNVTVDAGQQL